MTDRANTASDARALFRYNARAWTQKAQQGCEWSLPVESAQIALARAGQPALRLTPTLCIPYVWLPDPLTAADVLALASGGGQQGPLLAAAGARTTVLDASGGQLAMDRQVAEREGLVLRLEEGDMADLSRFDDQSFDAIVHPVSNCFVPAVRPVWREAARVLRPGGRLLAGFCNPLMYLFDEELISSSGTLLVRHALPYADEAQMDPEPLAELRAAGEPLEFGHTLTDQLTGQLVAGLVIAGLYEDIQPDTALAAYAPAFIATCAIKPPIDAALAQRIAEAQPAPYDAA